MRAAAADARNLHVIPAVLGVTVFIFGFGAMNAFWFLGNWDPSLLGLYDFKSATFGDAIVLPAITYFMALILLKDGSWNKKTLIFLGLAAALGFAVGVYTQYSWLTNPDTILNWTIPEPHKFNVAGWYHAVFLCIMTSLMSYLVTGLLITVGKCRRKRGVLSWHYAVVFCLSPAFLILNLNDFSTAETSVGVILLRSMIPAASFLLAGWLLVGRAVSSQLIHYLTATSVWLALVFGHAHTIAFSSEVKVAMAAFICLAPIFSSAITKLVPHTTYHLIALFIASNIFTGITILADIQDWGVGSATHINMEMVWTQALVCFVVGAVGVLAAVTDAMVHGRLREPLTRRTFGKLIRDLGWSLSLVCIVPVFGLFLLINVNTDLFEAFTTLWSFCVGFGLLFLKSRWKELEKAEDAGVEYWNSNVPAEYSDNIRRLRYRVWAWAVPILGCMVALYAAADVKSIKSIGALQYYSPPLSRTALVVAIGLLVSNGLAGLATNPRRRYVILLNAAVAPFLLALSVIRWLLLFRVSERTDVQILLLIAVIFPLISLSLFTAISIRDNLYRLRGIDIDALGNWQWLAVPAVQISLASIGATGVLSLEGGALKAGILTLVLTIIYPLSAAKLARDCDWNKHITITPPLSSVLQDTVHTSILSSLLIIYPATMLLASANLTTALVRILSLMGLLVIIFQWTLHNNIKHADRSARFIDEHPLRATSQGMSVDDFKSALRSHIRKQNIYAFLMLGPLIALVLPDLEPDDVGLTDH